MKETKQVTCVDCGRKVLIPATVSLFGTNGYSCGACRDANDLLLARIIFPERFPEPGKGKP
jgi:hypothetical protein